MKKYYHISDIKNKEQILKNGINSDTNNEIFLFTKLEQGILIAANQVSITDLSYFAIDFKGITGNLVNDNVADAGSQYQFILKQDRIEHKFVRHLKDESYNYFDLEELSARVKYKELPFLKNTYKSEENYIYNMICLNENWVNYYNEKHGTNYSYNPPTQFDPENF